MNLSPDCNYKLGQNRVALIRTYNLFTILAFRFRILDWWYRFALSIIKRQNTFNPKSEIQIRKSVQARQG